VAVFLNSDSNRDRGIARLRGTYEYDAQPGRAWAFWPKILCGPGNDQVNFLMLIR
jgi:hypothetical protein